MIRVELPWVTEIDCAISTGFLGKAPGLGRPTAVLRQSTSGLCQASRFVPTGSVSGARGFRMVSSVDKSRGDQKMSAGGIRDMRQLHP